jgi:hypothetical protein
MLKIVRTMAPVLLIGVGVTSATAQIGETKLTASDPATKQHFGSSVAVDGDVMVVGARDDANSLDAGAAYIFRHDGTTWVEEVKLTDPSAAEKDRFGDAVAISGGVVLVGAPRDDDKDGDAGSVFVYRYDGASWAQEAKLFTGDGGIHLTGPRGGLCLGSG